MCGQSFVWTKICDTKKCIDELLRRRRNGIRRYAHTNKCEDEDLWMKNCVRRNARQRNARRRFVQTWDMRIQRKCIQRFPDQELCTYEEMWDEMPDKDLSVLDLYSKYFLLLRTEKSNNGFLTRWSWLLCKVMVNNSTKAVIPQAAIYDVQGCRVGVARSRGNRPGVGVDQAASTPTPGSLLQFDLILACKW